MKEKIGCLKRWLVTTEMENSDNNNDAVGCLGLCCKCAPVLMLKPEIMR